MNKERFHNALALSLGYERIVKDKRVTIAVDDSEDPWVTLKFAHSPEVVRFKASDNAEVMTAVEKSELRREVREISEAVHQAYEESCKSRF